MTESIDSGNEYPNSRKETLYKDRLEDFRDWLLDEGKNPDISKGYAKSTVENDLKRFKQLCRLLWDENGEVVVYLSADNADQLVENLAKDNIRRQDGKPYAETSKRKMVNTLEKYFLWDSKGDSDTAWTSPITFKDGEYSAPDIFNKKERRVLREEVLDYKTIPKYGNLTPEQRDRWKAELAQRTGQKKEDITPQFWEKNNTSYKIPSLIYVSLDIGLRPCEVRRAKTSWYNSSTNRIRIPKEESSKNKKDWEMQLKDRYFPTDVIS